MPEYEAPTSFDDALKIKQKMGAKARVIAGGTDLLLKIRDGVHSPELLLDLRQVSLNSISPHGNKMRLGTSMTLAQILENEEIARSFPALLEACRQFAGPPIRNRGTLGGNIVNASPAADLTPPLMAYDAEVVLSSVAGERVLPLADFFTGPGHTVMHAEEILTEVLLPVTPALTVASFIKLGQRRSMAIAIVNLCTRITLDASGMVEKSRVVLGSVAATPIRATGTEALLTGNVLTDDLIDQAARKAREEAQAISDVRASKEYRNRMVEVLVGRALRANREQLAGNGSND